MVDRTAFLALCLVLFPVAPVMAQTQEADPNFDVSVARPAYSAESGPVIAIDAAHRNFHTMDGRYAPFAGLVRNDGYRVVSSTQPFTPEALAGVHVLVVANALGPDPQVPRGDAFTDAECDAVAAWVRGGGSLLLIADHAPFGSAAQRLATRFAVTMGEGWVFQGGDEPRSVTTQITYSRENDRLGDHPILRGRDADEAIGSVRAFTGQSLRVDSTDASNAVPLMTLGPDAHEAPDQNALNAGAQAIASGTDPSGIAPSVAGRLQGLAMPFGAGRVVILAEAGMLTAQVVTLPNDPAPRRFGMNVAGTDNRQFVLNVLHWLSGALN